MRASVGQSGHNAVSPPPAGRTVMGDSGSPHGQFLTFRAKAQLSVRDTRIPWSSPAPKHPACPLLSHGRSLAAWGGLTLL